MMSQGISFVDTFCYCGARYRIQARANATYGKAKLYNRHCPNCDRPINPLRKTEACGRCHVPKAFFMRKKSWPWNWSRPKGICKNCVNALRKENKIAQT